MKKLAYIADGFHSIAAFPSIQATISIFIEELSNDKISIANDAITIEIKAYIGNEFLPPDLLELRIRLVRVSFLSTLPPAWNLGLLWLAHHCL